MIDFVKFINTHTHTHTNTQTNIHAHSGQWPRAFASVSADGGDGFPAWGRNHFPCFHRFAWPRRHVRNARIGGLSPGRSRQRRQLPGRRRRSRKWRSWRMCRGRQVLSANDDAEHSSAVHPQLKRYIRHHVSVFYLHGFTIFLFVCVGVCVCTHNLQGDYLVPRIIAFFGWADVVLWKCPCVRVMTRHLSQEFFTCREKGGLKRLIPLHIIDKTQIDKD